FRRIGSLRSRAVRQAGFAAPHRDAAAKDPHHRALHLQCRLRAQQRRPHLHAAQPDHRRVPRGAGGKGRMSAEWTSPADLRAQVERLWSKGRLLADETLFPLELKLRGPESRALSERFEEVRSWIRDLE